MAEVLRDKSIGQALQLCEALRSRTKAGEAVSHVCLSTELTDNMTAPGVSDRLPPGYDWTKRRQPFVAGRPSGALGGEPGAVLETIEPQ